MDEAAISDKDLPKGIYGQLFCRTYTSTDEFVKHYENTRGTSIKVGELYTYLVDKLEKAINEKREEKANRLKNFIENHVIHSMVLNLNLNDNDDKTILHYAVLKNHQNVVKYLIKRKVDINSSDKNGLTPFHIATQSSSKAIVEILLENGAIFNALDNLDKKPIDLAKNKKVVKILKATQNLFDAMERNDLSSLESEIKAQASVNCKCAEGYTPLHYAVRQGLDGIVKALLRNKANPNAFDNEGLAPLHYATQSANLKMVKDLLFHGAMYGVTTHEGKKPSDLTSNKDLIDLFKLISESFDKAQDNDAFVIDVLNKIKDVDTIKAVMGAKNEAGQNLVIVAILHNFSRIEELKSVAQMKVSILVDKGDMYFDMGLYPRALDSFKSALEKRMKIMGVGNPATWDVQMKISEVFFRQDLFQEALDILEDVYDQQKEMLGLNEKSTLSTRSKMALLLQKMGQYEEALRIFEKIYQLQYEMLGANHFDTLYTQFNMASVLNVLERYDEALHVFKIVLEERRKKLGLHHMSIVEVHNNIGLVLMNQGKNEEALEILENVLERKSILLGKNHVETAETSYYIGFVLSKLKKYDDAIECFKQALSVLKKSLPKNHQYTLDTQFYMASCLYAQNKYAKAAKILKDIFESRKAVFGENDPSILACREMMETCESMLKNTGPTDARVLQFVSNSVISAAIQGDMDTLQFFIKSKADLNDADSEGRTPLHFAVSNGHKEIVKVLLRKGADINHATNKGNTALHCAVLNGHKDIVNLLLKHAAKKKLEDFVDVKTNSSGSTALHVAAKGGNLEMVHLLLKSGACFNSVNSEGKTPLDLSTKKAVSNLLKLIDKVFKEVEAGNVDVVDEMKKWDRDTFLAIKGTCNSEGKLFEELMAEFLEEQIVNLHLSQ